MSTVLSQDAGRTNCGISPQQSLGQKPDEKYPAENIFLANLITGSMFALSKYHNQM